MDILSDLFYAEAELAFAQNNKKESRDLYLKALVLKELVDVESATFSLEKQRVIMHIQSRLDELKEG
jgi:hypothetical protein